MTLKDQLTKYINDSNREFPNTLIRDAFRAADLIDSIGFSFSPYICDLIEDEIIFEWTQPEYRLGFAVENDGKLAYYWVDMRLDVFESDSGKIENNEDVSELMVKFLS